MGQQLEKDVRRGARRIAVLGLGNVLMGDDGLGAFAVRMLESRFVMPPGVSVEDIGTPDLDLHRHLADTDALILIDTIRAEGRAGEVRCYRREDDGLKDALQVLELADGGPRDVLLAGVIPARLDQEIGLSEEVQAALPALLDAVVAELERLGSPAVPRDMPLPLDLFWEQPAERV